MDFRTLERPSSPNSFLLAPEGMCAQARIDAVSPDFDLPPAGLFERLQAVLESDRSISVTRVDAAALRLSAVATTALLRFRDDLDAAVLAGPDGETSSRLAVYSRSRVGYSDLGANARRVRELVKKLRAA